MSEQLKLFGLRALADLADGELERDFEAVLAALVKDCTSRPSIKKTRRLTLTIDVEPLINQDGTCDDVSVDVEVGAKAPAKLVPTHRMRTTANGGLRYSPESPTNPDQKTIFGDKE